jgi:hypothetical protein
MKCFRVVTCLLTLSLVGLPFISPAHAFIGEYNSATGNDAAFMLSFKSSDVDYEDSSDLEADVERKSLLFGASKTINSKVKVYGSFNWGLDGKIDEYGYDLEHGYGVTCGGSYIFQEQPLYTVSGFGQLNYIFDEEYEYSEADADITFDGYEVMVGVMGKYKINMNFSAFGALQIMMISDINAEYAVSGSEYDLDLERDDTFGMKFGAIYDDLNWFVKGELEIGVDRGYTLTGGMKF